jgi:hypothetical protein
MSKGTIAKVNKHPPMDQLTILSIRWVAFFHPAPNLVLTSIVPQSTLTSVLPSHLATLVWTKLSY